MSRKSRRMFFAAAVLAAVAGIVPASAETLTDALIRAYQTSPVLESNRAALRGLDEAVPQARANKRPQVSAAGEGEFLADDDDDFSKVLDTYTAALQASLLLYDHGQTRAAINSARMTIAAGRADLRDVEQQVLFAAVEAYMDVRRDLEFVALARSDVERLEETLRATENRFEVGEVTRTDVSQAQAARAASRSTLASAEGQLEVSRENYADAVGSPPGTLAAPPPEPPLPATLEEAVRIGLQSHPSIVAGQFSERAAVYDFDRARAAKGPSVSVTGSGGYEDMSELGRHKGTFVTLGLSATMPLYTGGANDSVIRQAQTVLEQRRSNLQDAGRNVTLAVNSAWIQRDVARASIEANLQEVEAARIALEGVIEEARLGARSTLDVLDAEQDRLDAEAALVDARRNEYVAAYNILQAMGLLTVKHLQLGIETYDPDVYFTRVQSGPPGGYDTSAVERIRERWE